ncbi:MAG: hypothetical protein JW395_2169 [Nitrospira sp.]|nr:hypothetical protein [Nitrospira sp.]
MRIDLASWESSGLRCPDIKIDLRNGDKIPKVALIQMPNGTGKTTTLNLLRGTLSGTAAGWEPGFVKSLQRPGDTSKTGMFKVTLLVDGKQLTIELTLDFDTGEVSFKTTNPGSGGVVPRWHVPPSVNRFLAPEFLKLFIFDGEFADRLLKGDNAEADHAVDALCQIYLLGHIADFTQKHWDRSAKLVTAKTEIGLTKWRETHAQLQGRKKLVKVAYAEAKAGITTLAATIADLEQKITERLSNSKTSRDRFEKAQVDLVTAQGKVKNISAELMTAMRLPYALHASVGATLIELRDNLDRLKLPENTSAQFFRELVLEKECICGRPMDQHSIDEIHARAKRYLDADDAGFINALKSDIAQITGAQDGEEADAGHARVMRLEKALRDATRAEKLADQQLFALSQQLIAEGDDQLKQWQQSRTNADEKCKKYTDLVQAIEGPGDVDETTDKIWSLSKLDKLSGEAKDRIAEITKTVMLRRQTELIQALLEKAGTTARQRIKKELVDECNVRLAKILANDPLEIDKIDRAIRLKRQEGASVGQTLSVGYTFLMSVLSRGNNDFPLIVDSPANPIDEGVRREIGRLIPELCSQFVAFTINTERAGFVDTLERYAKKDVRFLTTFRKTGGTKRLMADLPKGKYVESANAILVDDRDYFYRFDVEKEA